MLLTIEKRTVLQRLDPLECLVHEFLPIEIDVVQDEQVIYSMLWMKHGKSLRVDVHPTVDILLDFSGLRKIAFRDVFKDCTEELVALEFLIIVVIVVIDIGRQSGDGFADLGILSLQLGNNNISIVTWVASYSDKHVRMSRAFGILPTPRRENS